jgi:S-disulfanyl-L-cysteine oxidoreductase SoxD
MTRSIPLAKCLDDVILAYAQNGEALRPEQGYPVRLLVPGFEGSISFKWLRRLKLRASSYYTREETSKYTDLMAHGRARESTFVMAAKSVITPPSAGQALSASGYHEIRGLAWSGRGKIVRVDDGESWEKLPFTAPSRRSVTRDFRLIGNGMAANARCLVDVSTKRVIPSLAASSWCNYAVKTLFITTTQCSAGGSTPPEWCTMRDPCGLSARLRSGAHRIPDHLLRFVTLLIMLCVTQSGSADENAHPRYGIGHLASPDLISKLDIAIGPLGDELPIGRGTVQQGRELYRERCAICHGDNGTDGPDPVLVGGHGSLASAKPIQTIGSYWPYATTLYDYIYRAMPFVTLGSLEPDQVYSLCAYLLNANGIIADDAVIYRTTLPAIRMPNRDGFIPDPRPDLPQD